jgi:exodeoxyribonuclease VII large subunit
LWGFNEEIVVRAAAESAIPLISAVGHETDWTLIDLAADARAPTPTKAAEWAVPKFAELIEKTGDLGQRLRSCLRRGLERARAHWKAAARGLPRLQDLLALPRQRFDSVDRRLAHALRANTQAHSKRLARFSPRLQPRLLAVRCDRSRDRLDRVAARASDALGRGAATRRARLERLSGRLQPMTLAERLGRAGERLESFARRGRHIFAARLLERRRSLEGAGQMLAALSYQSVLGRGFALIRSDRGDAIRSAASIAAGTRLDIEMADGRFAAEALGPVDGGPARRRRESDRPAPVTATDAGETEAAASRPRVSRSAKPDSPTGGQGSLF